MHFVVARLVPTVLAAQQPAQPAPQPADMIVTNARIHAVDEAPTLADAMAVREGKVQLVGETGARDAGRRQGRVRAERPPVTRDG